MSEIRDFNNYLSEDFLFLLDLCRSADQIFPVGSTELQLSHMWMDYLSVYECENLNERRLANMYISYLCAALAEGKLSGPFLEEPPKGTLKQLDYEAMTAALCPTNSLTTAMASTSPPQVVREFRPQMCGDATCSDPQENSYMLANDSRLANSTAAGSTHLCTPSSPVCSCPPRPCQCGKSASVCQCHRSTAGADTSQQDVEIVCSHLVQEINPLADFTKNLNSCTDLLNLNTLQRRTCRDNPSSRTRSQTSDGLVGNISYSSPSSELKQMRDDVWKILEAILAELRGDTEPGSNDSLECELASYKNFVMSHSEYAKHLTTLSTGMMLRNFLLLAFQKDLVQLLIDLMPTEERNI